MTEKQQPGLNTPDNYFWFGAGMLSFYIPAILQRAVIPEMSTNVMIGLALTVFGMSMLGKNMYKYLRERIRSPRKRTLPFEPELPEFANAAIGFGTAFAGTEAQNLSIAFGFRPIISYLAHVGLGAALLKSFV